MEEKAIQTTITTNQDLTPTKEAITGDIDSMPEYSHPLYYLEDSKAMRAAIVDQLSRSGVKNIATGETLSDLETYLQTNRAKAYLLDGNFPKTNGEKAELNAFEAAGLIKMLDKTARIAIFSSENLLRFPTEKANMKFFHKGTAEIKDIVSWLQQPQ